MTLSVTEGRRKLQLRLKILSFHTQNFTLCEGTNWTDLLVCSALSKPRLCNSYPKFILSKEKWRMKRYIFQREGPRKHTWFLESSKINIQRCELNCSKGEIRIQNTLLQTVSLKSRWRRRLSHHYCHLIIKILVYATSDAFVNNWSMILKQQMNHVTRKINITNLLNITNS